MLKAPSAGPGEKGAVTSSRAGTAEATATAATAAARRVAAATAAKRAALSPSARVAFQGIRRGALIIISILWIIKFQ